MSESELPTAITTATSSSSSSSTTPSTANPHKRKVEEFQQQSQAQQSTGCIDEENTKLKLQKLDETNKKADTSASVIETTDTDSVMSAPIHAAPTGDCTFCCEDLTDSNYVEYQAVEGGPWMKSQYCRECIEDHFIAKQWAKYLENIAKADCAAALRRVLSSPPQINVKDPGLPCPDNGRNDEVYQFWYACDQAVHTAKLQDSLVGAERDAFWAEKQAFLTATEIQEEQAKEQAKKEKDAETAKK